MKAMNVPTSIMIYPAKAMGSRDPEHLADAEQRTLAWFDKYLSKALSPKSEMVKLSLFRCGIDGLRP